MDFNDFKKILTAFADRPADVDLTKGQLLVQIHDEVITGEISSRDGSLYVREGGEESLAHHWLVKRIARLPQLVDRILDYIPEEKQFVTPAGELLDHLEENATDDLVPVADTVQCVSKILARRPGGTTSVLYLTSDAGEGKTTLINRIARVQASAYKNKQTDWLLVPIMLGGRPFLRFDDVVIGELVNRFRFQFFYYDAFIELVKLGVIVPAFDGFEEMFIESSSGEALSALGNLMNTLGSCGSVLISARKAYFEYKSFATQARLFDDLEANSVSFSRLSLNRWNRDQFLEYAGKRKILNGAVIYDDVKQRLSDEHHPLLTRAVLVKRLLDIAENAPSRELFLEKLGHAPHDYFFQFVDAIIEREVNEKWIDRSGQPAKQLITIEEHHELLALIAQEMWLMNTDVLKDEVLELLAELFSEERGKSPTVARQIKERIKQHALITQVGTNKSIFSFDHEEFRNFFLGQALAKTLIENSRLELKQLLSKGLFPQPTFGAAAQYLRQRGYDLSAAIEMLQEVSKADIIASFTRENCGGLIIRLVDRQEWKNLEIKTVSFPPHSLRGRILNNVGFTDCYFQSTSLEGAVVNTCEFHHCIFDGVELTRALIKESILHSCEVSNVIPPGQENRVFDPQSVNRLLSNAGFVVQLKEGVPIEVERAIEPDEDLQLTERALRTFIRSTQVADGVLRVKLRMNSGRFFNNVLPRLIKAGVLDDTPMSSGASRYRLSVPMTEIEEAMSSSDGKFANFIKYFQNRVGS